MTGKLPPTASIASAVEGGKLHAPSAASNLLPLCDLLHAHAPQKGAALEIASGTGQHVVAFARALPDISWQPTEIDALRRASVDAYAAEAALAGVKPCLPLDAAIPGWHKEHAGKDLIVLINLLHLISSAAALVVVSEAMAALAPEGRFVLYGPFRRGGALTSPGDQRFDAELRGADPEIGYKDDGEVMRWLSEAGAVRVSLTQMPANNLAFIAEKG